MFNVTMFLNFFAESVFACSYVRFMFAEIVQCSVARADESEKMIASKFEVQTHGINSGKWENGN